MSQITDVRTTSNVTAVRRVVDVADKIDVLEPSSAPLLQLTKKMKKKVAINPKFEWLEEESLTKTASTSAESLAGDTTVDVQAGEGVLFRSGDIIKVTSTGEQLLVSSVSTDELTVVRNYGSTAAATIAASTVLLIIGNANQEHATKRTQRIGNQDDVVNYTQIIRTPFGLSDTADASEMHGGGDKKHIRMMQLIEHQKDVERTRWFGEPKLDTSGAKPRRATGGLDYFIATNGKDAGGTITEAEFEEFLRTGFRYGSKTKWLFSAPMLTSAISFWGKDNVRVAPKDKVFGLDVQQWITPFGMVNIINNNLFAETTVYSGYGYLVDPTSPKHRFLKGRDMRLKTNIQDNSADGQEDEYIEETGLQFMGEKKNSVVYNITGFSS